MTGQNGKQRSDTMTKKKKYKNFAEKWYEEEYKPKLRKRGFKYLGPTKSSYSDAWFESPSGHKTAGSRVVKKTKTGFKTVGWDLGKGHGVVKPKYVHGTPPIRRKKMKVGKIKI